MYNPNDIDNFQLLSSYLRTTSNLLDQFVNGQKFIIDWKDGSSLTNLTAFKDVTFRTDFQRFHIPKRNKRLGTRTVYKCHQQFTKDILKTLKLNLDQLYTPLDCVHGFVKNKNIKSNAAPHIGKYFLLSLDIKDFFESIKKESVVDAFIHLGFKDDTASYLASICTLDNHLVQGFPTSPVIANVVCRKMDKKINEICKSNASCYTRYADDISISGDIEFLDLAKIEEAIASFGFKLNSDKTKKFKRGQNQYVTGLSISDSSYPRIPKPLKRRIRQQLYYIKKYGYSSHVCKLNNWDEDTNQHVISAEAQKTRNRLKGWIDYVHAVEPDLAKKYYSIFNEIERITYGYERKEFNKRLKEGDNALEYISSILNQMKD